MQDAYAAAVIAKPAVLLGRQLLPLTVGHAHALEAVGSPFVRDSESTPADVIFAAWICSRKAFERGKFCFACADDEAGLKAWGQEQSRADFAIARSELLAYLNDYTNSPKRWNKGDNADLRVPWTLALFWRVIGGNLSADREEWAWNMELPLAISYASAAAAATGDDSLMSDFELGLILKGKEENGASGNQGED